MKLLIISTCVVAGGKIVERGQTYDTKEDNKEADKEAFQLIVAGRALDFASDAEECKKARADIEKELADKAAAEKAAAATAEKGKK
jgi:hypothetical protein